MKIAIKIAKQSINRFNYLNASNIVVNAYDTYSYLSINGLTVQCRAYFLHVPRSNQLGLLQERPQCYRSWDCTCIAVYISLWRLTFILSRRNHRLSLFYLSIVNSSDVISKLCDNIRRNLTNSYQKSTEKYIHFCNRDEWNYFICN